MKEKITNSRSCRIWIIQKEVLDILTKSANQQPAASAKHNITSRN
jgi:hypothetical protein